MVSFTGHCRDIFCLLSKGYFFDSLELKTLFLPCMVQFCCTVQCTGSKEEEMKKFCSVLNIFTKVLEEVLKMVTISWFFFGQNFGLDMDPDSRNPAPQLQTQKIRISRDILFIPSLSSVFKYLNRNWNPDNKMSIGLYWFQLKNEVHDEVIYSIASYVFKPNVQGQKLLVGPPAPPPPLS